MWYLNKLNFIANKSKKTVSVSICESFLEILKYVYDAADMIARNGVSWLYFDNATIFFMHFESLFSNFSWFSRF